MPEKQSLWEENLKREKADAVREYEKNGHVEVRTSLVLLDSLVSSLGFSGNLRGSVVAAIKEAMSSPLLRDQLK